MKRITKEELNILVGELNNLLSAEQYFIVRENHGYCLLTQCPLNTGVYGFWDTLSARELYTYLKGVIRAIKSYNN